MIDNSEALFVVKLPAGQKLIEYKQIPFMIAVARIQAERPSFDPETDDTLEPYLSAINWEEKLKRAVDNGLINPLNPFSWDALDLCIGDILQQSLITVADLRKFLAEHNGGVEVAPSLAMVTPISKAEEEAPAKVRAEALATPKELIEAFGCEEGLFKESRSKFPWLKAACKVPGKAGNTPQPPMFDPYLFMVGYLGSTYGRGMTEARAWAILKAKFNDAYIQYESYAPDNN